DLGRPVHRPPAEPHPGPRDPSHAAQRLACGRRSAAAVGSPNDIWVEHLDEALEVTLGDSQRECPHGAIVLDPRGGEARALTLDVAPGARGELPYRFGRATDHLGDVAEGHVEYLVQHERGALGGR